MIEAKIIADSIANGVRLTTIQIRAHRFILPEINTHRVFSRNFSSSRAIPVAKMIEQVQNNPAMPVYWGKNKAGMQAIEELLPEDIACAGREWLDIRDKIVDTVTHLSHELHLHKQISNRLIEPFQWVNGVVTATEWDNFFALRDHPAAQPDIQELARKMKQAMSESTPIELIKGEWHLPYLSDEDIFKIVEYSDTPELAERNCVASSAARCARVSYNKHDGTTPSIEDDLELYNQLVTRPYTDKRGFVYGDDDPIHASPCEHQATPMRIIDGGWHESLNPAFRKEFHFIPNLWEKGVTHMDKHEQFWSGNLRGWIQARQLL